MSGRKQSFAIYGYAAIGACIILAASLILWPYSPAKIAANAVDPPKHLPFDEEPALAPLVTFNSTRQKSLFSPERSSRENSSGQYRNGPATGQTDIEGLQLKGTLNEGTNMLALIAWAEEPDGAWLSEGDQIRNWSIEEIRLDQILLQSDEGEIIVPLRPPTGNFSGEFGVSD